jgi:hypothetical protein
MTDLTTRELLDTIIRSWRATRATFKKPTEPANEGHATLQPDSKDTCSEDERADASTHRTAP